MVRFASQKLLGRGFPQPRPKGRYPRSNLTIGLLLRKEVIQPLVPQRLPCYDFIPVIYHTLGAFSCKQLDQRLRVQQTSMM